MTLNRLLQEFFADMAGVDKDSASFNTIMRQGLESAGYSGTLNKMLKDWSKTVAGQGSSVNTAFRLALLDMGGSGSSINTLASDVMQVTTLTWSNWGVKWNDESRQWDSIG